MAALLAVVLAAQFRTRRYVPVVYWLAILFTFALGTSAGDLVSEQLGMGSVTVGLIFGALIAMVYAGYRAGALGEVLAFWTAYVLTRPFGASLGDFLTATPSRGGLGLGTNGTSGLFLAVILAAVAWFTVSDRRTRAADEGLETV